MTVATLFGLLAAGILILAVCLLVIGLSRPCPRCNDTGIIETGNNDLPCKHCRAGDKVTFNTTEGPATGAELRRRWDDVP